MEQLKTCLRCGISKPTSLFNRDHTRKDGFNPYCKQCKKEQRQARDARKPKVWDTIEALRKKGLKRCTRCGRDLPLDNFYSASNLRVGKGSACKECLKKNRKPQVKDNRYYETQRKKLDLHKIRRDASKIHLIKQHGAACMICGLPLSKDNPVCVFDFHHTDPAKKDFNVATRLGCSKTSQMYISAVKEIKEKCIVVCANCHRKLHYKREDEDNES